MIMHATEASKLSQQQRKRTMKINNLEKYEKMVLELLGKKIAKSVAKGDNKLSYRINHNIYEFHRNGYDSDKINLGKSVIEEVASQLGELGYKVRTSFDVEPVQRLNRIHGYFVDTDYRVYSIVELEW